MKSALERDYESLPNLTVRSASEVETLRREHPNFHPALYHKVARRMADTVPARAGLQGPP